MRESTLREVLLVKAIEETDLAGILIPFGDRERAAREALRAGGLGSDETTGGRATSRVEAALADRASRLARPLLARHPVLGELLSQTRWPTSAGLILFAAAFMSGFAISALGGSRRINILAPPFLGLVAWNLLIYLWLAIGGTQRLIAGVQPAARFSRSIANRIGRRLGPLIAKTARVDTVLGEAMRHFASDWSAAAAPILGQQVRLWLHLAAAAVGLGLIAGLYLRGLVLRYEAGWESTFLGPEQVLTLIGLLFGPAAAWIGITLPQTVEQVARLRWDGGGGEAAPWIHLIALCLGGAVVLPRLMLAALAAYRGARLQRVSRLPASVADYARGVLGPGGQGLPTPVSVTPYAFEPPPGAASGLAEPLTPFFGRGAEPELRAAVAYGDEDAIPATFESDAHRVSGRVLLMNLAATPETENHGAAIVAARDHVRRERPEPRLLVLVDESSYAARFASDAALAARIEERRGLWRGFVAGYGVEVAFGETARRSP